MTPGRRRYPVGKNRHARLADIAINRLTSAAAWMPSATCEDKRNHDSGTPDEDLPIVGTIASQFNDPERCSLAWS